jgi:glutathione S-transferase
MAWSTNPRSGEPIERKLVEGDAVADYLAEWRPDGPRYDKLAPDIERAGERAKIGLWLAEQARRVRAREALEMNP